MELSLSDGIGAMCKIKCGRAPTDRSCLRQSLMIKLVIQSWGRGEKSPYSRGKFTKALGNELGK